MRRHFLNLTILSLLLIGADANAQYCISNLYNWQCTGSQIESFSTSGGVSNIINLNTGCSGATSYFYYSNQTHTATAGSTVTFKIVNNPFNAEYYKIWVDWDNSLTFDPAELMYNGWIYGGDSTTGTFIIPTSAITGSRRMRVRSCTYNSSFTACSQEGSGEAEDYNLNVISPVSCSSSPVAGTASASQTSTCASNGFTLWLAGFTASSGTTIQWQSRPSGGGPWTNISGASNTSVYTYQSAASDYRAYLFCGSSSDTSTVVSIAQNPYSQCYCSPNNGTTLVTYANNFISNVSLSVSTLNYPTTTTSTSGYTQVTSTTNGTANIIPGDFYTFSAVITNFTTDIGLWLDYNQNGVYESSERIPVTVNTGAGAAAASFVVPQNATPGNIGMRVSASGNSITGSCNLITYGEVEDYTLTVVSLPACSGTPVAGISTGPSSVCSNVQFLLSVLGSTAASGLSYQWQTKPTSGTTWSTITGATTKNYLMNGQTTSSDYRLVLSCGTNSDTSIAVSVAQNPLTQCYCSPNNGTTLVNYPNNYISNVSIAGTTLNSSSSSIPANGYTLVPTTPSSNTASLNIGNTYIFNATISGYISDMALWIDYNMNGLLEATEKIPVTINPQTSTASAVFTVPSTASAGLTGLRVSAAPYWYINSACANIGDGEVEDYGVTLVQLPACSGNPTAGVTNASQSTVCPGTSVTLTLSSNTSASGLSYQWQSKTATGNWTDISGATSNLYVVASQNTTTSYRAFLVCGAAADTSSAVTVNQNPVLQCYCSPASSSASTTVSNPLNLLTNTLIYGTTLNYTSSSVPANGYTAVPSTPASNTATLVPGQTYIVQLTGSTSNNVMCWIDFDQNSAFDYYESLSISSNNGIATAYFTVPLTAQPGVTAMRVTASNNYFYSSCDNVSAGEIEDYEITIGTATTCTGTPTAGTAASTSSSVCGGEYFMLYLNGSSTAYGLSYQWQSKTSSASTWTNIAGATMHYYSITSQTIATDYRAIVSCGGSADTSAPVSVTQNSFYQCYCSPALGNVSLWYFFNYITGVSVTGTTLNTSSSSTSNGYTFFNPSVTSNTATLSPGVLYTINVNLQFMVSSAALWIDYNQNGLYDLSEQTTLTINTTTNTGTATFLVPNTALTGTTGLRVVASPGVTVTDACWIGDGEIEQYQVTMVQLPACAGTPTAGTASSSVNSTCSNVPFTLSLTGTSMVSGLTYKWQSKPITGTAWSNITGATLPQYIVSSQSASTDYRAIVSCGTNSDTSNVVSVAQTSFNQCYCSPSNGTLFVNYPSNVITNVTIVGTTLNTITSVVSANGYKQFGTTIPYNTTTLNIGQTYTLNTTLAYYFTGATAWIDFDQNGVFDPSETIALVNSGSGSIATAQFTVPANALAGLTGLRVIGSNNSIYGPCGQVYDGEVEDYVITIAGACPSPSFSSPTSITSNSATINWQAVSGAANYEYVLDQSPSAPSGGGTITTNLSQTVSGLMPAMGYYFHLRSACGTNQYSAWSTQQFSTYATGINGVEDEDFSFDAAPNPAKLQVVTKITGERKGKAYLTLIDMTGKTLKTVELDDKTYTFDMSAYANGFYLLRYKDDIRNRTIKLTKQ